MTQLDAAQTPEEYAEEYAKVLHETYALVASIGTSRDSRLHDGEAYYKRRTALLCIDWAALLPYEITRIWARRFTGATWVYFFNRYATFLVMVIFLVSTQAWSYSDRVRRAC